MDGKSKFMILAPNDKLYIPFGWVPIVVAMAPENDDDNQEETKACTMVSFPFFHEIKVDAFDEGVRRQMFTYIEDFLNKNVESKAVKAIRESVNTWLATIWKKK